MLDEVTTGLDPAARRDTWVLIRRLRDEGKTVILVTHAMDEAEALCDRLAVIVGGRVAATGTPAQVYRRAPLLGRRLPRHHRPFPAGGLT